MKTIEERADAYVGHPFEIDEFSSATIKRQAFIDGATEQRKIDIDKTCEWMKDFKTGDGEFPLYNFVGNLRKAMEE